MLELTVLRRGDSHNSPTNEGPTVNKLRQFCERDLKIHQRVVVKVDAARQAGRRR